MPEPTPTPRKITLEELLRLKRHERPGPEYWARFDRELNERVWRALAQATRPAGLLAGLFGRRARWLAAGVVSTGVAIISWPGGSPVPPPPVIPHLAQVASHLVSTREVSPVTEPVRVAMAVPVAANTAAPPADAPPQFAVAAVENTSSPAGHNKVPATVALAADQNSGARYAADNLDNAAFSPRLNGSAY